MATLPLGFKGIGYGINDYCRLNHGYYQGEGTCNECSYKMLR